MRYISLIDVPGFTIMTDSEYEPSKKEMLEASNKYPKIEYFDIIDNKIVPHKDDPSNYYLVDTNEVAFAMGVAQFNESTQQFETIGNTVDVYKKERIKKHINYN